MSFSFGANTPTNNNSNTWGASTGFGRRASVGGPLSTTTNTSTTPTNQSLFGNTANKPGDLFGNLNTNTTGAASGGLFGNSATNNNTGVFGNSTSANTNTNNTTNLFGNSSNTSMGNTGLLGNNTTANNGTTGLFGNTQTTGAQGTATSASNLFGPRPTLNTSGGLFGSSLNPGAGAGSGSGTSLFGNTASSSQQTSGNLFGNSSNSGGLFGGQNQQNQAPSVQLTVNNSNPYNYSQVLSNLQASSGNMPESITTSVFPDWNREPSDKKRRFSYLEKPQNHKPKSSLLNKLGQTFRLIRNGNASASLESLKGLFTTNDELKPKQKKIMLSAATAAAAATTSSTSSTITPKSINKPSYKAVDARRIGSMKRLIIKTKPVKYHLINVNKVFNAKRRKVITDSISADKLLTQKYASEEESEDELVEDGIDVALNKSFSRYSYKVGQKFEESDSKSATRIIKKSDTKKTENNTENTSNLDDLHDGYWSTPTIKQLSEMNVEELSSLDNFIVGRVGCGQIAFNYPVDLSQIYLDSQKKGIPLEKELFGKVIELGPRVVLTYNDHPNKPAMGFGLNVPATITLEGVKPKENVSVDRHINFLKKQIGMEFVTYDPITYIWVFKVKHFSIWGLIDEDDTERQDLLAMKRKQDIQELEASAEYSRIYENEKYQLELKKQRLNEQNKVVPGGWEYNIEPSDDPLSIKRRLVSDEISKQLVKYRSEKSTEELSAQISDITIESDKEATPVGGLGVAEYINQITNVLPTGIDLNEVVSEKVYEPHVTNEVVFDSIQIRPNLPTSDDWLLQLELANQLTSALAPFAASPKAKQDNRLNIQIVDDILFSDFNQKSMNKANTNNNLSPIDDMDESEDIFNDNIPAIFSSLLRKSEIASRNNSYPIMKETKGFQFKDLVTVGQEKEEKDIVTLASALFDDIEIQEASIDNPNVSAKLIENTRNKLLGDWLRNYNLSDIDNLLNETKDDVLERVFIYLCAGDLTKAIQAAIDADSNHLSVVVTLSDSNDVVIRSIAKNQLNYWQQRNMINTIPKPIIKVYQLLAGEFEQIIDTLPWNLALALKLFYSDFENIECLISEFKPLLPHESPITDILNLYIAGNGINLSSIESTSLNTKLKWLVCKILSERNGFEYDTISESFGKYLQSKDYWKEGILVFSSLSDRFDEEAKEGIRELVISKIRYIKSSSIDKEQYATTILKIPREIIYEAAAIAKNKDQDYWGECEAYSEVELWTKAHIVIIDQLGPNTIISNSPKDRSQLLNIIGKFPSNGLIIPDWNKGAGIYAKYLSLSNKSSDEGEEKDAFEFLLSYLPFAKQESFEQKVALDLISKTVGNAVLEDSRFDNAAKKKISDLPLGEVDKQYFLLRLSKL